MELEIGHRTLGSQGLPAPSTLFFASTALQMTELLRKNPRAIPESSFRRHFLGQSPFQEMTQSPLSWTRGSHRLQGLAPARACSIPFLRLVFVSCFVSFACRLWWDRAKHLFRHLRRHRCRFLDLFWHHSSLCSVKNERMGHPYCQAPSSMPPLRHCARCYFLRQPRPRDQAAPSLRRP